MPSFLGLPELGLLLVILLLLFGPGKLPQVAKSIGESIQQFKKSASAASTTASEATAVSSEPTFVATTTNTHDAPQNSSGNTSPPTA